MADDRPRYISTKNHHLYVGKVKRTELPGETGEQLVTLEVIRDDDVVELSGGEEFVTFWCPVDVFAPR